MSLDATELGDLLALGERRARDRGRKPGRDRRAARASWRRAAARSAGGHAGALPSTIWPAKTTPSSVQRTTTSGAPIRRRSGPARQLSWTDCRSDTLATRHRPIFRRPHPSAGTRWTSGTSGGSFIAATTRRALSRAISRWSTGRRSTTGWRRSWAWTTRRSRRHGAARGSSACRCSTGCRPRRRATTAATAIVACGCVPDIVGTTDGLAQCVYVRESRRIQAEFTVLEQHVGVDARGGLEGAEPFAD